MNAFVQTRIDYVRGLPDIGGGWIAGGGVTEGVAPSQAVCHAAIDLLTQLGAVPALQADLVASNVLMGPLTTGGVGIELRLRSIGSTVIVNFNNDLDAEITLMDVNGATDVEIAVDKVSEAIFTHLGLAHAVTGTALRVRP